MLRVLKNALIVLTCSIEGSLETAKYTGGWQWANRILFGLVNLLALIALLKFLNILIQYECKKIINCDLIFFWKGWFMRWFYLLKIIKINKMNIIKLTVFFTFFSHKFSSVFQKLCLLFLNFSRKLRQIYQVDHAYAVALSWLLI